MRLLIDLPPDYETIKQTRLVIKRNLSVNNLAMNSKKPKIPKAKLIKCANNCCTEVEADDPFQSNAIQCCHQSEQFSWIEHHDNCSRWLRNVCRIKLNISVDSLWFCSDRYDMHQDEDEN
ncbi:unnamed protein product [Rotaria sp. Silwood1]|nr:unnamed protein product [Rotaria sp. Silwood1]